MIGTEEKNNIQKEMIAQNPYATPTADPVIRDTDLPVIPGLENLQYPLTFSFKVVALAPQLTVTDASGRQIVYIKQKLFKFKEKVEIFTDKSKSVKLGSIKANKVIDWSARYFFETENGAALGSVGRKGMKSLWKASYEVFTHQGDTPVYKISEENPMSKIFDSLLGEIPIVGFASVYLFHPKYAAVDHVTNQTMMRLTKKPAFFEGKFELEKFAELTSERESSLIMSFLMLVLLERGRG